MQGASEALLLRLPRVGGAVRLGVIAFVAVICGAMAVRSTQLAVTLVLLVVLLGVRWHSRTAGIATLWVYWLLIPGLRRVLDIYAPAPGADPLSLFPFVATALIAVIELRQINLDRRARVILVLAGGSLAIGVPMGLLAEPSATIFAMFAYGSGVAAFVIGWGDGIDHKAVLERVLQILLPILALYAIGQYLLPLTSWDSNWVDTADIASIKAPGDLTHIRVFATLNSYFTLAIVLSVGLMLGLGVKRRFGATVVAFAPLILALVFTYNRSAWLGLVIGLFVFLAASRRSGGLGKVVGIVLVCLAALVLVGSSNPTTRAFTERVTSLGSPDDDVSTQDRLATTEKLLPESMRQPLGAGLGQAGIASQRLAGSGDETLANIDNGYVSALYQGGPFSLGLLLVAIGLSLNCAFRAAKRAPPEEQQTRAALLAVLVMLVILLASGEVLFGISGAMFWYFCGMAVATVARDRESTPNQMVV
jgi:hypothetical protein